MERITKYDSDFGYYIIDIKKFNKWEGSDLIDYIGELEDRIEKIQKIIKKALKDCENELN